MDVLFAFLFGAFVALLIGLVIGFVVGIFYIGNILVDRARMGMIYIRDEKGNHKWVKYEAP